MNFVVYELYLHKALIPHPPIYILYGLHEPAWSGPIYLAAFASVPVRQPGVPHSSPSGVLHSPLRTLSPASHSKFLPIQYHLLKETSLSTHPSLAQEPSLSGCIAPGTAASAGQCESRRPSLLDSQPREGSFVPALIMVVRDLRASRKRRSRSVFVE